MLIFPNILRTYYMNIPMLKIQYLRFQKFTKLLITRFWNMADFKRDIVSIMMHLLWKTRLLQKRASSLVVGNLRSKVPGSSTAPSCVQR